MSVPKDVEKYHSSMSVSSSFLIPNTYPGRVVRPIPRSNLVEGDGILKGFPFVSETVFTLDGALHPRILECKYDMLCYVGFEPNFS